MHPWTLPKRQGTATFGYKRTMTHDVGKKRVFPHMDNDSPSTDILCKNINILKGVIHVYRKFPQTKHNTIRSGIPKMKGSMQNGTCSMFYSYSKYVHMIRGKSARL